jgi:hypothetical protein
MTRNYKAVNMERYYGPLFERHKAKDLAAIARKAIANGHPITREKPQQSPRVSSLRQENVRLNNRGKR